MNCRPGDLAITVRNALCAEGVVVVRSGVIVRVVRLTPANVGNGMVWELEKTVPFHVVLPGGGYIQGEVEGLDDNDLKPLRDPGDDAVDETLQRLPAPRETEVA
jgi:hypothetical protein